MTDTDKFALLRDLAGLVRKHGLSAFSDLAKYLRDPDSLAELVSILEAVEVAGQRAQRTQRRSKVERKPSKTSIQELLSTISESEPDKAKALSTLYDAVVAKRAFPTLRELRSFATDNGLRSVSATSRDKALIPFFRDLAGRPIEELRAILARIRPAGGVEDRTLEGWTNIILGKSPPEES